MSAQALHANGANALAVVALAGYALIVHFFGAGIQLTGYGNGTAV
jgi:predicted acyltransferase